MTDGERAIWAAAFVRRLLDTAKPTDSACATVASYQKWQHDTAGAAAQAATDVLGYARRALRSLLAHGLGPGTTTFDETCEMLGVRCCAGDAACPDGDCPVCEHREQLARAEQLKKEPSGGEDL